MSEQTRDPRGVGATTTTTVLLNLALPHLLNLFDVYPTAEEMSQWASAANMLNLSLGSTARDAQHWLLSFEEWGWAHRLAAGVVWPIGRIFG